MKELQKTQESFKNSYKKRLVTGSFLITVGVCFWGKSLIFDRKGDKYLNNQEEATVIQEELP